MQKDTSEVSVFKVVMESYVESGIISGFVGGLCAFVAESKNNISIKVNAGYTVKFIDNTRCVEYTFNLNMKDDCMKALNTVIEQA